jgi:predicted Fe-Mo cluster-binding NifX family protein
MKLAVTSTGPTLDDSVEARFGRCAFFLIIDSETLEIEPVENPNIALGGGAGIQSAQLMANKGVSVVLTGNCGPNAFRTFGAAGIQVITGVSGQVRQAVTQYKSGQLAVSTDPSVESHFGMGGGLGTGGSMGSSIGTGGGTGRGMGMGGGRGMGRGMGMGGGKGMGRGMGMGGGRGMGGGMGMGRYGGNIQPTNEEMNSPMAPPNEKDELDALKEQANILREQMEFITARIKELEDKKE